MVTSAVVRTLIIGDDNTSTGSLRKYLTKYPRIEVSGCNSQFNKARDLLLKEKFDLIFLDVEEGLNEWLHLIDTDVVSDTTKFEIVAHLRDNQAYDIKYSHLIFDSLSKPCDLKELHAVIEHYLDIDSPEKSITQVTTMPELCDHFISLPTSTGLKFLDKHNIVYFHFDRGQDKLKPRWMAVLNSSTDLNLTLRRDTTSTDILHYVGNEWFVQINKSVILNLHYLDTVEFHTHDCVLIPPFDNIPLKISRRELSRLRSRFEKLK